MKDEYPEIKFSQKTLDEIRRELDGYDPAIEGGGEG